MSKRKVFHLLGVTYAMTFALAAPLMAAAPSGFQEANIGAPDTDGSTEVNGDVWTVSGSGNQFDGNAFDQLYFVYRSVNGNGSVQARMVDQGSGGSQYAGVMVRESINENAPIAGLIMSTSTLAWITRTAADENATRRSGVSEETYPKFMRVQRVGNSVTGYTSEDGKLWQQISGPTELPLAATSVMGIAVSSRGSDLTTVEFDNVQVQEGVVSVAGLEAAATDTMALIAWEPIGTAVGYNVYRGARGASLDQMTLLNATPQTATFFFDQAAANTSLRDMSYVVAPVFPGADGAPVVGPAVRAR